MTAVSATQDTDRLSCDPVEVLCDFPMGGILAAMKALDAHFDGTQIVLDEPFQLAPNTKLKVVVVDESDGGLSEGYARLSEAAFARIWDNPRDAQYDKI